MQNKVQRTDHRRYTRPKHDQTESRDSRTRKPKKFQAALRNEKKKIGGQIGKKH